MKTNEDLWITFFIIDEKEKIITTRIKHYPNYYFTLELGLSKVFNVDIKKIEKKYSFEISYDAFSIDLKFKNECGFNKFLNNYVIPYTICRKLIGETCKLEYATYE